MNFDFHLRFYEADIQGFYADRKKWGYFQYPEWFCRCGEA